jgi:SAM-dependent methyltransferase
LAPPEDPLVTGFLAYYQAVRREEGWGDDGDGYYRALPFEDRSGRHPTIWRIRAATYRGFLHTVMEPIEAAHGKRKILDLGAGNCWLAYRLAGRGHEVAAVDLNDDLRDGLGASVHYGPETQFALIQASFDHLPWPADVIDLAIYNGSFHYSIDYRATLREALRLLRPRGRIVILDSPFYRRSSSGLAMVREREQAFRADHGLDAGSMTNEGFLTYTRLNALGHHLGITWKVIHPYRGIRSALRPLKNRISGHREQARFPIVTGFATSGGASR